MAEIDIDCCSCPAAVRIHLVGLRSRPGCMVGTGLTGRAAVLQLAAAGMTVVLHTAAGAAVDVAAVRRTRCAGRSPTLRNCRLVDRTDVRLEEVIGIGCSHPAVVVRMDRVEWPDGLEAASRTAIAAHSSAGLEDGTLRSEVHNRPPELQVGPADGAAVADPVAGCSLRFGRRILGWVYGFENESASGRLVVGMLLVEPGLGRFR